MSRDYIRQAYRDGVPVTEIAAALGISCQAVKDRARRDPECPAHGSLLSENKPYPKNGKIGVDAHSKENIMRKATQADLDALREHCDQHGLPYDARRLWWHKTKEFSVSFYDESKVKEEQEYYATLLKDMKAHAPKYRKRKSDPKGEHLLVLPQADIHVGKWIGPEETGFEYNTKIAVDRAKDGTASMVAKARAFGVKSYAICIGNDILHTDDGKTTTSGTPQDTDGTWFHNFRAARDLYIAIIEEMALHADVHLIFVPSNHDWRTGFALSEVVAAHFQKHPNVHTLTTERHRKYLVFGNNLMMFSHGDGAKEKDLHWHLATEAAEVWSKTCHRYIYLGHLHHKIRKVAGHNTAQTEKDKIGFTEIDATVHARPNRDVCIEYVRSPSPADSWHDRNGYVNTPAMESYLHHERDGQVARFTQFF